MKELMHTIYSEIPQRSYNALARGGALEDVLLALIVDPDEARDVADDIEADRTKPPPITIDNFVDLGTKALTSWRITLSQWSSRQRNAKESIAWIAIYDKRLSVWAACKVARKAVSLFVPAEEWRPAKALEKAEDWVCGKASIDDVDAASEMLQYISNEYARVGMYPASQACWSAMSAAALCLYDRKHIDVAAKRVVEYASVASIPIGTEGDSWVRRRDEENRRLRSVIADACMTFPMPGDPCKR